MIVAVAAESRGLGAYEKGHAESRILVQSLPATYADGQGSASPVASGTQRLSKGPG